MRACIATKSIAYLMVVLMTVGIHTVSVSALDNGLAKTPPMGYNTWYDYTGSFTESDLKECVDAFVRLDLKSYGYNYWNLDDLWVATERYPNGSFYADPTKFPSKTLRPLADYVHSKGLLFGAYTDRGTKQCGPGVGSLGYEDIDAQTFADWQIDYLKEDSCSATQDHDTAFQEYGKMRDALNKTGRSIMFSLCGWNPWYAPVGYSLGNLWRIGPDDTNWNGVLTNIDINSQLAEYAGPGGWNDPCLLLAEDLHGQQRMTELQTRAQFSMWAIMASPLIISANIRNMSATNIETYTNKEVIAVDQDVLGKQGTRVFGTNLKGGGSNPNGWTPATAQPCNSSDARQIWEYDGSNPTTPPGTLYNAESKLLLDVLDCDTQLGLWPWVTDGCSNNQGFYFNFSSSADHHLTTALRSTTNCVNDNGNGAQLTLEGCQDTAPSQQWTLTPQGQVKSGAGNCITTAPAGSGGDNATAGLNVWARTLSGGATAFVFLNVKDTAVATLECDAACMGRAGVDTTKQMHVRDLWTHTDLGTFPATNLTVHNLAPDGGHVMLLVTPVTV
eukprot:m.66863 g.66863  ORF g.66863 m.66863 type:complete len:558 (+) comp8393_c0_seq1:219-1892(+)